MVIKNNRIQGFCALRQQRDGTAVFLKPRFMTTIKKQTHFICYASVFYITYVYLPRIQRRARRLFSLFPVIQLWKLLQEKGPRLLGRPIFAGHMFCQKVDQFVQACLGIFSIRIAPLAVFFVERTVGFPADRGIVQRHAAALTDPWAGSSQKRVDGYVKKLG